MLDQAKQAKLIDDIRHVSHLLDLLNDHMQNKKHGRNCCVAKIVAKYNQEIANQV